MSTNNGGSIQAALEELPAHVLRVVNRKTQIPVIAAKAAQMAAKRPELVRGDVGQVVGIDPTKELLYGPPAGLHEAREAVANLYRAVYGAPSLPGPTLFDVKPHHVAITSGAAEALSQLFRVFAFKRRVGIPRAHWSNYQNAVDLAQGEVRLVDVVGAAGGFDAELLERQVQAESITVLVVNLPCNPTGVVVQSEQLAVLARVIKANNVVAIADEVYARLRFDGGAPDSLVRHAPEHAISIGSASKSFMLAGARVGWVVSAVPRLTNVIVPKLVRACTGSPNVLGQKEVILRIVSDLVDYEANRAGRMGALCRAMAARRTRLVEVLTSHGMACVNGGPAGTIFLMATLPSWWPGDDEGFCEAAVEGAFFSAIPGAAFGLPGQVRLSFGAMDDAAMDRLDGRLDAFEKAVAAGSFGSVA